MENRYSIRYIFFMVITYIFTESEMEVQHNALDDPKWSLERRASSGLLIWRKDSPQSRIRFRFDVEVLEFEKQPHEYYDYDEGSLSMGSISSTIALGVTCIAAVAISIFLPWYLMDKAAGF